MIADTEEIGGTSQHNGKEGWKRRQRNKTAKSAIQRGEDKSIR